MSKRRDTRKSFRLSVGLEEEAYLGLLAAAQALDVSLAWVVRRAIADYLRHREAQSDPGPFSRLPRA